jgi:hypothetical protein
VQALKNSKELVGVAGVKANAIVPDLVDNLAVVPVFLSAHLDDGWFTTPCVLDGIAEQIDENLAQERVIGSAWG